MRTSTDHWITALARVAAAVYLLVLTLALLLQNPFKMMAGGEEQARDWFQAYLSPLAHFLCFLPLGFLFFAARWRLSKIQLLLLLLVYAIATEILQGWIPNRTPELIDAIQDFAGLAAGVALYKFAAWARLLPSAQPAGSG